MNDYIILFLNKVEFVDLAHIYIYHFYTEIFRIVNIIAFLIIVRTGHRKAESTARRKDSNRGMF
ncbi:hypothetical protein OZD66_05630, partial [Wolbachia endosymbiont of Drosophila baimaii]|uniref:hypothetical protein n=1 Tax=Wolbachia endosymbiont of Drosophila baimaii TaxID=375917 RepID=UPI0023A97853